MIGLLNASVDAMEEIFSVITHEKTWYFCAQTQQEAEEWVDEICGALEANREGRGRRRRLSSHASESTVKEMQSRDIPSRVDEFMDIYIRSTDHEVRRQATKGTFAWSSLRNVTWRVWLGCLSHTNVGSWVQSTRASRARYDALKTEHPIDFATLFDVRFLKWFLPELKWYY